MNHINLLVGRQPLGGGCILQPVVCDFSIYKKENIRNFQQLFKKFETVYFWVIN
jgi:hypothetical protein